MTAENSLFFLKRDAVYFGSNLPVFRGKCYNHLQTIRRKQQVFVCWFLYSRIDDLLAIPLQCRQ